MKKSCCAKLHAFSFGVALGIVWGLSILITGLVAWGTGYGAGFVETMRTIYIGYEASVQGSIVGGIWGFVDMFIGGVIIAAIYNVCFSVFCRHKCAPHSESRKSKE